MASRKLRMTVGAIAGAAALALLLLAWFWWVPELLRERAERWIERRTGLEVRVGSVALVPAGVMVSDTQVGGPDRQATVSVGRVRVIAKPWRLALEGTGAIEGIFVTDVRVGLKLTDALAEETHVPEGQPRAGADRALQANDSSRVRDLPIVVSGLSLAVEDAYGSLVQITEGRLVRAGPGWRFTATQVDVGEKPFDALAIRSPQLLLQGKHPRDLRLVGATADGVQGTWASRESPSADSDVAMTSIPARLRAARRRFAALRAQSGGPPTAAVPTEAQGRSWLAFIDRASVRFSGVQVQTRTANGTRKVLEALTILGQGLGQGRVRAQGEGSTASGGRLRWDLVVNPRELRSEGHAHFTDLSLALVAPFLPAVPWYRPERARLDGEMVFKAQGPDEIAIRGSVSLREAGLHSSRVAAEPVEGLSMELSGVGAWSPPARRLQIDEAELRVARAQAKLQGALQWQSDRYAMDLTATVPPTDCNDALSAIPRSILADAHGFSWAGSLAVGVSLKVDSEALDDTKLKLQVPENCRFETVPPMAALGRFEGPFLHRVREPDGTWFEMTGGPGSGNWVSIHEISPFFVHAVIAHEDASFFRHAGFAPWAIEGALTRNLKEGRFAVGASTISMQLAKNLFLHREKTLARKVQEVLLTWWLERALEKTRILELYLNLIEYGHGVYGIRHAARHYFGREPVDLTLAESAFLATILPAPKSYATQYLRGQPSASTVGRLKRFLQHMADRERIDDEALQQGVLDLDALRFRREGEPMLGASVVVGSAAPLPYQRSGLIDPWAGWEEEGSDEWIDDVPAPEDRALDGYDE